MRSRFPVPLSLALLCAATVAGAVAQEVKDGTPGVITEGSKNTSIGGQAAARKGDRTDGGSAIVEGSKDVFINGQPAAVLGDKTGCGGITIGGASNVFINSRPVARAGDLTTGCPQK
ncbi:MAG: hypothetical protein F9K29_00125 [Hyphomicrobiaceae bacterium]|nr:MAG: hypothetical protein F9K29_00125 [Hyphomicrobiaceae bacterium]